MGIRRVAVVFHQSLMLEGLVAHLEEERSDLELTSVDPATVDVLVSLRQLAPDVIILDGESLGAWPGLTVQRLLDGNRLAKVMDVNPHKNEIMIYEQHEVSVGTFKDLLDALDRSGGGARKSGGRGRKSITTSASPPERAAKRSER